MHSANIGAFDAPYLTMMHKC